VGVCLSISKNKGDLALLISEHQFVDLLHVHLLNLDADEFQSSSCGLSLFGALCYWISRSELIRPFTLLSSASVASSRRDVKLHFLVYAM
jgi:hypothetical protein